LRFENHLITIDKAKGQYTFYCLHIALSSCFSTLNAKFTTVFSFFSAYDQIGYISSLRFGSILLCLQLFVYHVNLRLHAKDTGLELLKSSKKHREISD